MSGFIELSEWTQPVPSVGQNMASMRVALLDLASKVLAVKTREESKAAVELAKELKTVCRDVESARKQVKAPFLEIGKKIDSVADEYCASLIAESKRIELAIYAFQKIEADEERKRQEEIRRKQAEEQAKIEAEKKAALAAAKSEADKVAAELRAMEATRAAAIETKAAIVSAPPKSQGIAKKRNPKFEVLDISTLYKARPDLVKLEVLTLLVNSEILAGMEQCPGLKVWIEETVTVRS